MKAYYVIMKDGSNGFVYADWIKIDSIHMIFYQVVDGKDEVNVAIKLSKVVEIGTINCFA